VKVDDDAVHAVHAVDAVHDLGRIHFDRVAKVAYPGAADRARTRPGPGLTPRSGPRNLGPRCVR
jgi:hypothetical protein